LGYDFSLSRQRGSGPNLTDRAPSRYDEIMSDNVFEIGPHRTLEALIKELGGLDECKRLGFVFQDENKIMSLSSAAAGTSSVAEAFAAGYECAAEFHDPK
jgi:hypothetical protein